MSNLTTLTEWKKLRDSLQVIEKKILKTMEENDWHAEISRSELLLGRQAIMDKMFRLHITEHETALFREKNNYLHKMCSRLRVEHLQLVQYYSNNTPPVLAGCNNQEVWSMLRIGSNDHISHFEDDVDYGSDFEKMIEALYMDEELVIRSYETSLGETPKDDPIDSNNQWVRGCLVVPQFASIDINYSVQVLCVHKSFTIPDLLRINLNNLEILHGLISMNSISSGE